MSTIQIYTDGGCIGNPGPGGWAFVAIENGGEEARKGAVRETTNNRMELTAVIEALEYVRGRSGMERESRVQIVTDSEYVRRGISEWIHKWIRNGWQTTDRKPVKNKDLWMRLNALQEPLSVEWGWVKGHSGNTYNELCDSLVQEAIRSLPAQDN